VDTLIQGIARNPMASRLLSVIWQGWDAGQPAALTLHLVSGLPSADNNFTNPTHRLRVRGHHADRA
jgi:hypothetical protein